MTPTNCNIKTEIKNEIVCFVSDCVCRTYMEEGGRGRCGGGRRGRGRGGGGGGGVSRLIVMMSISEEHLALSRPLKDIHYGAASPPPLIPLLLLSDPTDQPNILSFFLPPPYSPFYSCLIFIFLFLTT